MRPSAAKFGLSVGAAAFWVARAAGKRLDRVAFGDRKPGRAWNRTRPALERRILNVRRQLRERSVLGEYGPDAIGLALQEHRSADPVPSRTTIYRVLARQGALDGTHRQRRPAPPKGWYLPDLASGKAELDSFDFIEDLKIADDALLDVLTATSVHGGLADAWIMPQPTAAATHTALLERWRADGLPTYAQFDNDTIFQGGHRGVGTVGRVSRLCLALQVIPMFAPPREPGFQNAIEGFNGLWQRKVWQRYHFSSVAHLTAVSERYIAAYRTKTAYRREAAAIRRPFPRRFELDLAAPLRGTIIFLRRTDASGKANLLGQKFAVDRHWVHRLLRCEVDFTHTRIRFYALRRREPNNQPLLREISYHQPNRPFRSKS